MECLRTARVQLGPPHLHSAACSAFFLDTGGALLLSAVLATLCQYLHPSVSATQASLLVVYTGSR